MADVVKSNAHGLVGMKEKKRPAAAVESNAHGLVGMRR